MLKVKYTEIVKDKNQLRGKPVNRSKNVTTLSEAVVFSKFIANTTHVIGKPVVEDDEKDFVP